jgi:hypothetical protein
MKKENWINEVLNSTNGMTKVVPDELLFSKIQNAIKNRNKVSTKWVWLAAASFAILLSLNSWVLFSKNSNENTSTDLIASTISKNNQLY